MAALWSHDTGKLLRNAQTSSSNNFCHSQIPPTCVQTVDPTSETNEYGQAVSCSTIAIVLPKSMLHGRAESSTRPSSNTSSLRCIYHPHESSKRITTSGLKMIKAGLLRGTESPSIISTAKKGPLDEDLQYRPLEEAKRIICPTIDALPAAEIHQRDRSIVSERDKAEEWTQRFFRAAFSPLDSVAGPLSEENAIDGEAQDELEERIARRMPGLYDKATLEARFSLLFYIAHSVHVGGEAIYPFVGHAASGADLDETLSFRQRLGRIEHHLHEHKWTVINVIEEQQTYRFVGNPDAYVENWMEMLLVQRWRALACPLQGEHSVGSPAQFGEEPPQPAIEVHQAWSTESGEPSSTHPFAPQAVVPTSAARPSDLRPRGRTGPTPTGPEAVDSASNVDPRNSPLTVQSKRDRSLLSTKLQRIDSWVGRLPAPRYRPQRMRSDSCDSYYDSSD